MNQRSLMKRVSAVLMAAALTISTFPQFHTNVYAAENQLPTKEQFATAEELKTFDTNDQDGKNPAKVYFGNNDQQWWIAGSQNENVTLFAASPLEISVQFNPNKDEREYNGQTVYSNHYGASDIKGTVKGLETSYFTHAEQVLMNETTIHTNDTKNSSVYSTTDKLYLAYGEYYYDGQYITVGTNSSDNDIQQLSNGLRVDKSYWGNSGHLWLRAPHMTYNNNALVARSGKRVLNTDVDSRGALVPAFELNLSSVIFASAAPAATSEGTLATNDAFTLRHKSQTDIGIATISQAKGSIAVTDVTNENTYIVVQNSQGAWAKKVSSNDVVFASDIDSSLTSFENCKIWLETTSDGITYAEEATQGSGHNVKVNVGENLTVTDGNTLQANVSGNITEITITVNDGYYLPDGYTDTIQGLNGLNVKDVTQNGFTITGTPTSDVNITLPAVGKEYFTVEGGVRNQEWTYSNGVLTIQKPGDYKISADGSESNNRIVVAEEFKSGNITIENINLKVGYNISPFEVNNTVDLTIILSGNNKLYSEAIRAGIEFNDSMIGRLTIDGTGALEIRTSQGGAAIGGAPYKSGNNITIKDGNIKLDAFGQVANQPGAAGIGGGYQGSAHNLVIDGGNIKALSGLYSAAIGAGADNADGDITINGGTIIAETSQGGAAIGSGYNCQNPIKITINGGNITANAKGGYGVDIGSGSTQESEIFINGGTITCEKEGIGYNDNVVISGGSIKAPAISLDNKPAHNSKGEQLYPITIMNESGLNEISIDGAQFTKYGNHISDDGEDSAFYLYLTGEDHKVTIGDKEFVAVWDNDSKQFIQKDYPLSPQDIQIEKVYKDRIVIKSIEESVYGKAEYSLDGKNYQESNMFTGLEADTEYTVYVRYKGNNSYVPSKPVSVTTKTLKDGNGIVKEPSVKPTVYHDGLKLSDVKLPNGWKWENEETSLFAGTKNHSVLFDTTNYEAEYDFTGVDGYSADNHVIQRTVEVEVQKAETVINVLTDSMDKDYNKNPVNAPEVEVIGNTNSPTFEWFVIDSDGTSWLECDEAPKNAGKYKVVIKVAADDNYKSGEKEVLFNISKADNELTVSLNDWVYGEKANTPTVTAKFGDIEDVVYTYSSEENGKYTTDIPTNVGTWYIKATLKGTDNYNDVTVIENFNISKATNTWKEDLSITGWTYNEKANTPTAKAQFGEVTFTYSSEENGTYTSKVPKNAGTYYVKASVAGTKNYTGLESVIAFTIAKADTTLTFEKENIDKTYDKNAISEPMVTKNGSGNDIVFEWYIADGNGWQKLDNAPSDVGAYKVVASVKEDTNYNGASIEKEFSISMADNKWTKELSIKDWTYGETASAPSAAAKYGDVVYTYSNSKDGTYTSDVPVNAGTWYVKASVAETANYAGLESAPVSFEIKKADSSIKFKDSVALDKVYDTNAVVVTEEQVEKTGSTGTVSFTFEKKVNDEWKTVESATEVGTYRVTATLAEDNNHTSVTSKPLEFTITKANSAVTITTPSLDKAYDGNAVTTPEYTISGSDGNVTIKWQENTGSVDTPKWEDLKSAPSTVGTYRVVVELAGNANYKPASATLNFVISQTTNAWTEKLSITGWTYNEKANVPTAKAQFGDVVFSYSSEENGTYTNEVPKNAGTYYVKATVAGTENYTGLESTPVAFEIAKAIPAYEKVTGLVLGQGQALSKIELPEQFKWVDETMTADELGTHTFKAVYTPEDTANYQTIEVEIEVEVVPTPVAINHVPTINASDKTIAVGDKFAPLKDVTANDKEDGDLTSKIKVIKNTVDTKKAGTYEVTYQVTDSQGASITKTIKVTVKAAPVNPDKDKPDNDKNNGSVETGDRTNLLLWEVMLIGSSIILLYSLYRKKRKTQ